jgi:hypothetical protein
MLTDTTREIIGIDIKARAGNAPFKSDLPPQATYDEKIEDKSPFSDEETSQIREEYQQCLEEKTQIITPDMSDDERKSAEFANSFVPIQCKIKSFQSAMNIFAFKV